jgi:hypothetical protein
MEEYHPFSTDPTKSSLRLKPNYGSSKVEAKRGREAQCSRKTFGQVPIKIQAMRKSEHCDESSCAGKREGRLDEVLEFFYETAEATQTLEHIEGSIKKEKDRDEVLEFLCETVDFCQSTY